MTTKREAEQKLNAAIKGCEKVQAAWNAAHAALGGSVSTNGYGIYHDDGRALRDKLHQAQEQIKIALTELREIDWPTEAEYDLF